MCMFPTFSLGRIFKGWVLEIDCWFMKSGQWGISEVSGHAIAMLRTFGETDDIDAMDSE